ncbi:MAG: DUF1648 domain-containing protein [Chitinispirillaceae bacterium]|nr:DUF1648 domain-containing protein [Chitinispirillaceae bacterium]
MHILFLVLTIAICILPIYVLFAFMPYLSRRTECFGVGIPEEKYDAPELTILRKKYRNAILGVGGLIIAAVFLIVFMQKEQFTEMAMITGLLLLICTEGSIYLLYHKKMKILKTEKGWMAGKVQTLVADTTPVSGKECASPRWFLLYPVIIILTTLAGVFLFDNMPDRVSIKFDLQGNVSRWADKSIKLLFFAPLAQLFISITFILLYVSIRNAKRQIDASNPEESKKRIIIFRKAWFLFTVFGGLLMLMMFGFLQLSFVGVISNPTAILVITIGPAIILIAAAIVLSVKVGQGGSRVTIKTDCKNHGMDVNRDDDQYWKYGAFYLNRNDPALFLEKRAGIGWTMNFGHPLSRVIIIGFVLFIAGFVILSNWLTR